MQKKKKLPQKKKKRQIKKKNKPSTPQPENNPLQLIMSPVLNKPAFFFFLSNEHE